MNERREHRHINLVGPTLLIGAGIILLLSNLGYLTWSIWDILWRFWPVIIIGWGLELLLGRRSRLGALLAFVILLAVMAGAIGYAMAYPPARSGEAIEIREVLGDFDTADITLEPIMGNLIIQDLNDSDNFVEGVAHRVRDENIEQFYSPGSIATFSLKSNKRAWIFGSGQRTWELGFHPNVTLDFDISTAVSDLDLDLRKLRVDEIVVDFAVGETTVRLPRKGTLDLSIDGAIGSVVIEVPRGMAVRVRADAAIVDRNFPGSYMRENDTYFSPNYDSAESYTDIDVDLAIGSITIKEDKGD